MARRAGYRRQSSTVAQTGAEATVNGLMGFSETSPACSKMTFSAPEPSRFAVIRTAACLPLDSN